MMQSNAQFEEFKAQLRARNVHISWLWQARRDGKAITRLQNRHADVGMIAFTGEGFQPMHLTAVVIDYGKGDGFGLYTDHGGLTIDQDAAAIAKPRRSAP